MAKIALVCSPGGHLAEVLSLAREFTGRHEFFLCVTNFELTRDLAFDDIPRIYRTPYYWRYQYPFGVFVSLAATLFSFIRIFWKERPDAILTTGAEVAVPALVVNRLFFRRPSLFIESLTRVEAPSLTGRLAARLADRVFVQWPGLLGFYGGKAEYHGGLL